MQPINGTDENELQKAINSITSSDATAAGGQDAVSAVAKKIAAEGAAAAPAENVTTAEPVGESSEPAEVSSIASDPKADYGDPDLGEVKIKALTDLRPLLDKVDLSPESKFKIYREIIIATNDKAAIEPAYESATQIAIEKDRAQALLFVVEMIDKLGVAIDQ